MLRTLATLSSLAFFVTSSDAFAQDPTPPADSEQQAPAGLGEEIITFMEMPLEQLIDLPVLVATLNQKKIRESPAIVTLIRRDEIIASGARDLMDVLEQVPGFAFASDVASVVSAGFRGNWGQEGKILLLIDGQEMNELLYTTIQLGHHYPVDQIERIEIIRGPGSAVYGGYAGVAVINVITRSENLHGAYASISGATSLSRPSRATLSVQAGETLTEGALAGVSVSASGFFGLGRRSDGIYRDPYGGEYSMNENSKIEGAYANLSAGYKGLRLRFIYDNYALEQQDGYGPVNPAPALMRFSNYFAEARYEIQPTAQITITPRLSFKSQTPWEVTDRENPNYYQKTAQRLLTGVTATFDPIDNLQLLAGAELHFDGARLNSGDLVGAQSPFGGTDTSVSYNNFATFAQVLFDNPIANLTVGARYEVHSQFGASFVPRVGLTRLIGRAHFKLLFANAFRAPAIENISLNPAIEPERTTVFEAEAGYQLTDHLYLVANAYDITIGRPILFYFDPVTESEQYQNFGRTGTRGIELEARLKYGFGWVNFGYSFYSAAGKNDVAVYTVPEQPHSLVGLPNHKATVAAAFNLPYGVVLSTTAVYLSPRYGFFSADAEGVSVAGQVPSDLKINLVVHKEDVGVRGLEVSAGAYNLLDRDHGFVQPYDGGHGILPSMGREFGLRLSYTHPF